MTDDEILALFDGFRRSVGQRDERRDTLSIRATMAARRIRARGTVTERDLDLVGQIRAHSPASDVEAAAKSREKTRAVLDSIELTPAQKKMAEAGTQYLNRKMTD